MNALFSTALIFAGFLLAGCDRAPAAGSLLQIDQVADPFVPDHEQMAPMLGSWFLPDDAEPYYTIAEHSDGRVEIRPHVPSVFTVVINDVSWAGNTLQFSQYHYHPKPSSFNGVQMRVAFRLSQDQQSIYSAVSTIHTDEPLEEVLIRK